MTKKLFLKENSIGAGLNADIRKEDRVKSENKVI